VENETTGKRLNKYISETGYCSRREADKLIEEGRVKINGIVPVLGTKVLKNDLVTIDDKPLKLAEELIYLAFNKPVGVTCTTDLKDKDNIVDFLKYPVRIFPIGRLDKPSEGLIFLTNDGDIVNKILRAGNNHEKEYLVSVDRAITPEFIEQMGNGVKILETVTKKCKVVQEGEFLFRIILTQGLNRQIRRMCQAFGYKVETLKRVRIMNITLEGIRKGEFRHLTAAEMEVINGSVQNSIKTEEGSITQEEIE
jgi:23S rRNA pseudouridine2604 synthase